jgi:hypothetical protein
MKVKSFMHDRPERIEQSINDWFDNEAGTSDIIKTETVVTPIMERAGEGRAPCIVVTVWYEPPSN